MDTTRNTLKISIIMPVYNDEANLAQRLDGIAVLASGGMEVVCVDDGSTDGSLRVLAEYAGRNQCFKLVSKENGGVCSAWNVGLTCAEGEYVYFLSGECTADAGMLKELLEEAAAQEPDIVLFESGSLADDRKQKKKTAAFKTRREAYEYLAPGRMLFADMVSDDDYRPCVHRMLFRRSFLIDAGHHFDEGDILADELFVFQTMLTAAAATYRNRVCCRIEEVKETDGQKNFREYFECYREMMAFVLPLRFDQGIHNQVLKRINTIKTEAFVLYLRMPAKEKREINWGNDVFAMILFQEFREWRYFPSIMRMPVARTKRTRIYPVLYTLSMEFKYLKKNGLKLTVRKYIKAYKHRIEEREQKYK